MKDSIPQKRRMPLDASSAITTTPWETGRWPLRHTITAEGECSERRESMARI